MTSRIALIIALITFASAAQQTTKEGSPPTRKDVIADTVKANSGRPVLVNVFATWCEPCRSEMPLIAEAQQKWSDKGVVFLGISIDEAETVKNVEDFVRLFNMKFQVVKGGQREDMRALGLHGRIPATILFDERGLKLCSVEGIITREELESMLRYGVNRREPRPHDVYRPWG